jgi:hypothetical protein
MVKLTVVPVIPLAFVGSRERHEPSRMGPACEQLLPLFPGHSHCPGLGLVPDPAINPSGLNSRFGAIP